jgi:hypothetical protein
MQTDSLSVRPPATEPTPAAELHIAPEPAEPHSLHTADELVASEPTRPLAALAAFCGRASVAAMAGIAAFARRAAAIRPARANRFAMLTAAIALAAGIGAAAGAAGAARWGSTGTKAAPAGRDSGAEVKALKGAIAQMRGSIRALSDNVASLRVHVEAANKAAVGASAKLSEQVSKLHEQVARLQEAGAPKPAAVAGPQHLPTTLDRAAAALERAGAAPPASDVTGSIPSPAPRPAEATSGQPNILDGWSVRRVYDGLALIEGRYGAVEVESGDLIRGLGRVKDIRRQDGRWVVETSRGLIVAR